MFFKRRKKKNDHEPIVTEKIHIHGSEIFEVKIDEDGNLLIPQTAYNTDTCHNFTYYLKINKDILKKIVEG